MYLCINVFMLFFNENIKHEKLIWSMAAGPGITISRPLARAIGYKLSMVSITNELTTK